MKIGFKTGIPSSVVSVARLHGSDAERELRVKRWNWRRIPD
jgi:hypothetical protein